MPLRGFGCWKVDKKDCEDTIYKAIKIGYRLFDGACDYGNEVEVGRGIHKAIEEGLVKRDDLFSKDLSQAFKIDITYLPLIYSHHQIMEYFPQ